MSDEMLTNIQRTDFFDIALRNEWAEWACEYRRTVRRHGHDSVEARAALRRCDLIEKFALEWGIELK